MLSRHVKGKGPPSAKLCLGCTPKAFGKLNEFHTPWASHFRDRLADAFEANILKAAHKTHADRGTEGGSSARWAETADGSPVTFVGLRTGQEGTAVSKKLFFLRRADYAKAFEGTEGSQPARYATEPPLCEMRSAELHHFDCTIIDLKSCTQLVDADVLKVGLAFA